MYNKNELYTSINIFNSRLLSSLTEAEKYECMNKLAVRVALYDFLNGKRELRIPEYIKHTDMYNAATMYLLGHKVLNTLKVGKINTNDIGKTVDTYVKLMLDKLRERMLLETSNSGPVQYHCGLNQSSPTYRCYDIAIKVIEQTYTMRTSFLWRERRDLVSDWYRYVSDLSMATFRLCGGIGLTTMDLVKFINENIGA